MKFCFKRSVAMFLTLIMMFSVISVIGSIKAEAASSSVSVTVDKSTGSDSYEIARGGSITIRTYFYMEYSFYHGSAKLESGESNGDDVYREKQQTYYFNAYETGTYYFKYTLYSVRLIVRGSTYVCEKDSYIGGGTLTFRVVEESSGGSGSGGSDSGESSSGSGSNSETTPMTSDILSVENILLSDDILTCTVKNNTTSDVLFYGFAMGSSYYDDDYMELFKMYDYDLYFSQSKIRELPGLIIKAGQSKSLLFNAEYYYGYYEYPINLITVAFKYKNEDYMLGCDYSSEIVVTEPAGFNFSESVSRIEPTCTKNGYVNAVRYTVDLSPIWYKGDVILADNVIPAKAHNYIEEVKKATPSKNGKITSVCKDCKTKGKNQTIYSPKKIELSKNSFSYTGKEIKPKVTVKDSKGNVISASNYTVKYEKNKKVGTAKITVKFKGNYSGTLEKKFKIVPKGTTVSKLEAKSKGFKITWKKQTKQVTGYEIQYSTSKKFAKNSTKTVDIKDAKTVSKIINGLKGGNNYYVRVRTYKTVNGNKFCSSWSKVKSIKTKK